MHLVIRLILQILIIFALISCQSGDPNTTESLIVSFYDEVAGTNDKIYVHAREDIEVFKRFLNFPLTINRVEKLFTPLKDEVLLNYLTESDLDKWNEQISNYSPTTFISFSTEKSFFTDQLKESGGYILNGDFIGEYSEGKTFILSTPIISNDIALIFYDVTYQLNNLNGGSVIFAKQNDKWTKIASNEIIITR